MEQIWRTELFLLFESASYVLCPAMFRQFLRAEYCVDHRQSPAIALCMYVLRLFSSLLKSDANHSKSPVLFRSGQWSPRVGLPVPAQQHTGECASRAYYSSMLRFAEWCCCCCMQQQNSSRPQKLDQKGREVEGREGERQLSALLCIS